MSENRAAPLRWGILGTGFIAGAQTSDLLSCGFTVSAVGSRTHDAAADFASCHGIRTSHGSYEELVADPEVDVVYVATPHPFHLEHTLLALSAGKHVLVEKPFAMNADQARQMVARAEEKNLVVLEAMWTRFLPHMVRIREIIRDGTLGEVSTLLADHDQTLPTDPTHRINDISLGGGALLDLGIYPVSFAFDVFGTPTSVLASASRTETGVDRQTAMILSYADGQQALLHCALNTTGGNTASILGTAGRIEIDGVWYSPTTFTRYDERGDIVEQFRAEVAGRGMQYQAGELERLVRAGALAGDILAPAESVAIMDTLDEVRRQIGLRYEVAGER